MPRIMLSVEQGGYAIHNLDAPKGASEEERSVFVQTDYEFPAVAGTFGFDLSAVTDPDADDEEPAAKKCDHRSTDGSVACKECGLSAGVFIQAAMDFLDSNDGAEADDPGYFNS